MNTKTLKYKISILTTDITVMRMMDRLTKMNIPSTFNTTTRELSMDVKEGTTLEEALLLGAVLGTIQANDLNGLDKDKGLASL